MGTKEEHENELQKLRFDRQVIIHRTVMWFSHWNDKGIPVFWHEAGGVQVNYIDHTLKPSEITFT